MRHGWDAESVGAVMAVSHMLVVDRGERPKMGGVDASHGWEASSSGVAGTAEHHLTV